MLPEISIKWWSIRLFQGFWSVTNQSTSIALGKEEFLNIFNLLGHTGRRHFLERFFDPEKKWPMNKSFGIFQMCHKYYTNKLDIGFFRGSIKRLFITIQNKFYFYLSAVSLAEGSEYQHSDIIRDKLECGSLVLCHSEGNSGRCWSRHTT